MQAQPALATTIHIKVDDNDLETTISKTVLEVTVDQHAHLPDMCVVRVADPALALLDNGPLQLTKKLKIEIDGSDGKPVTLFDGEITALEPCFEEGMVAELVVRAYDISHRLFRETKSRAFLNKKDSDLAEEIAADLGLGRDIETTEIVYPHIFQANQSDLAFLLKRARRIGYECFVADGKLAFRRPPTGAAALTLTWGQDLLSFYPRMTLAEQVSEVVVRGWDPEAQEAIVGRATTGNLYPTLEGSQNGSQLASSFGDGKVTIVEQPVVSQAEADAMAAARLDELSGAFVLADGTAFRRPDIRAGRVVTIAELGQRLSGDYLVTRATHVYTAEGLDTNFSLSGTRCGMLVEDAERADHFRPTIVTALVTNSDGSGELEGSRVKVQFPWLTDEAESDWARVAAPSASANAGFYALPQVGDEVLVTFEHGDFNRPIVIGSLWNARDNVPPNHNNTPADERPLVPVWMTRKGHHIAMADNADDNIVVKTAGGHHVTLSDADRAITIESASGLIITLDDQASGITIESSNTINVKASGNMKLEAGANIDIEAGAMVNVKGAMINLN